MTYIYQVVREFNIFGQGTQQNVLGTYSTMSDAQDAADEAVEYGGSDEDSGYIEIMRHELNPKCVSTSESTGYPMGR